MMTPDALLPPLLLPAGKILLIATGSVSFGVALKSQESPEETFIRLVIGVLTMTFFIQFAEGIFNFSIVLTNTFRKMGDPDGLKVLIWDALKRAAHSPNSDGSPSLMNIPALMEQILRTGVWGVVSSLTEFFFLMSSFLLELYRDVTWQLILLLYPLACGVYPLWPKVLHNLAFYSLCVSLWWPIFTLIAVVTSIIARTYMAQTHSWGLAIIALEVIAIFMTFRVPDITKQLISGVVDGSLTNISVRKVIGIAKGAV